MFRPDNIGKLFGQDHLTDVLIAWLEDLTQVPQSVLFAGPYGTGKTTIARILARKLASSKTDLKEINAADARGIEDVRGWAESAKFSPLGDGGKVYIIDELHQMTNAAQSALLKVIEEPPSKIYFFLCTTEPFKLLAAIRSRCTVLDLKLLGLNDTRSLLAYAFANRLCKEIVEAIHYKSGGHARDAVKMAEIAVMTNVVSVDELSQKVGYGRVEIEKLIMQVIKGEGNLAYSLRSLTNVQDTELVAQVMDNLIDVSLLDGNWLCSKYSEILDKRIARREHKLSAQEQILHFVSLVPL